MSTMMMMRRILFLTLLTCASALVYNQTAEGFFKLAHATSLVPERLKYLADRLRVDHASLCVHVPDCDEVLMRIWVKRVDGAHRRVAEMDRLRLLLIRLQRHPPRHGR